MTIETILTKTNFHTHLTNFTFGSTWKHQMFDRDLAGRNSRPLPCNPRAPSHRLPFFFTAPPHTRPRYPLRQSRTAPLSSPPHPGVAPLSFLGSLPQFPSPPRHPYSLFPQFPSLPRRGSPVPSPSPQLLPSPGAPPPPAPPQQREGPRRAVSGRAHRAEMASAGDGGGRRRHWETGELRALRTPCADLL